MDGSVYEELCSILDISLNEFLVGEDIAQENMIQKSETNIIKVIRDNINKQKCLKVMEFEKYVFLLCIDVVVIYTAVLTVIKRLNKHHFRSFTVVNLILAAVEHAIVLVGMP